MTRHTDAQSPSPRIVARSEDELVRVVRDADAAGVPVRLVGAGDTAAAPTADPTAEAAFAGRVVQVATRGMTVNDDGCSVDSLAYCGGVQVTVAAGQDWAEFVGLAVDQEWVGVERLAAYRGTVGGATVGNVAAYGQSVGDTVAAVRTWDRMRGAHQRFAMVDCAFREGGSRFSRELLPDGSPRYVVLDVAFLFRQGDLTDPITDPDLARLLHLGVRERARLHVVRDAVLAIASTGATAADR